MRTDQVDLCTDGLSRDGLSATTSSRPSYVPPKTNKPRRNPARFSVL